MGASGSKGPDEAQQRRAVQVQTIQHGLVRSDKPVHFENIVFEGCGNRAVAYFGAIKVLEEQNLLQGIKRYAGVGVGAGWAMLLSIGLTPGEIVDLGLDKELSYHAKYLQPSLAQKLGGSPLGKAIKIARNVLLMKTGKEEVTFREVYGQFGKELCIVATNLTTGSLEYFHPKTTPDVPVLDALIMSSTPPGIMKPKYLVRGGKKHHFVDGSVLCNFPVYCFDGWYLSMAKEDSFLSRLGSGNVDPPFRGFNDKTLGLKLITPGEGDFGEQPFLSRLQYEPLIRPQTKLARAKWEIAHEQTEKLVGNQFKEKDAGLRLIQHLRLANISTEDTLSMSKLQRAIGQGTSAEDIKLLFGQSPEQLNELFIELEQTRDSKVTFEEFAEIAQQKGKPLDAGATTRDIRTGPDMLMAVMSAVEVKSKQVYLQEIDIMRAVGINADYVGIGDHLDFHDKTFLVTQGEAACLAYLLEYIQNFMPPGQVPLPQIYSALPNRMSRHGSVIHPNEISDYSAPINLYPSLPASFASALGDSDHLKDTIETNWPNPGGDMPLYPGLSDPGVAIGGFVNQSRHPPISINYNRGNAGGGVDPWSLPSTNAPPGRFGQGGFVGLNPQPEPPTRVAFGQVGLNPQPEPPTRVAFNNQPQPTFQSAPALHTMNQETSIYPGMPSSRPSGSPIIQKAVKTDHRRVIQLSAPNSGINVVQGRYSPLNRSPQGGSPQGGSPHGSPMVNCRKQPGNQQGLVILNGQQQYQQQQRQQQYNYAPQVRVLNGWQ